MIIIREVFVVRVQAEGGGFPVRPKICTLSQRCGAGVNFRPAGGVREQVAGSLPGVGKVRTRLPSTRRFLFPFFVSPRPGKGIRQPVGWKKVCGTTRTRMLPANLDHLRVGWRKRGACESAWVTPGHNCLCP